MEDETASSGIMLPSRVAMATMHGKEQVLQSPFADIGMQLVTPSSFDTDQFGTFTRDRPRAGTMLDAARAKAEAAMQATGLQAALASEGAYGPHPSVAFLAAGRELLLFIDRQQGLRLPRRRSTRGRASTTARQARLRRPRRSWQGSAFLGKGSSLRQPVGSTNRWRRGSAVSRR